MNHFSKTTLITIIVLIAWAKALASEKDVVCLPVGYLKSNVVDKPDLLILEEVRKEDNEFKVYSVFCQIKSDNTEGQGKFVAWSSVSLTNYLDFDSKTGIVYKGNANVLQTVNLKNGNYDVIYKQSNHTIYSTSNSVALDWVTKNLYAFSDNKLQIFNVNDDSKSPRTIMTVDKFDPVVKVFPNKGYIVVLTTDNTLMRYDQDGYNPHVLYFNPRAVISAVALDYYENKIYWIESETGSEKSRIRYTNLAGDKAKTFSIQDISDEEYNIKHLHIDEKYIYFVKRSYLKNHLLRVSKVNDSVDKNFKVLDNTIPKRWTGTFKSILILNGNPQVIDPDHPCQKDNGGCSGYCVGVPGVSHKVTKKCIVTEINNLKKVWNKVKSIFN